MFRDLKISGFGFKNQFRKVELKVVTYDFPKLGAGKQLASVFVVVRYWHLFKPTVGCPCVP